MWVLQWLPSKMEHVSVIEYRHSDKNFWLQPKQVFQKICHLINSKSKCCNDSVSKWYSHDWWKKFKWSIIEISWILRTRSYWEMEEGDRLKIKVLCPQWLKINYKPFKRVQIYRINWPMPLLLRNIRTFTSLEASLRMLTDWLSPWRSQDHLLLVSIRFRWHYLWHRSNTLKFKLCKLELEPVKKERIASRSRFTDLACCRRNAKGKIGSYRRSFNITSDNLKCFMSLLIYF